jgi:hypothetical protein
VKAVVAADPAVTERILPVLRNSLDGQSLDLDAIGASRIDPLDAVRVVPGRSPDGPVAYLWLDLVAKQPSMILVDARSGLVHVRPLAVHPDPDVVETELIRFVVYSSMEAILKGQAQGVSREEFERSLAPPRPPAPPPLTVPTITMVSERPNPRWTVSAGYSGAMLTSDSIVHGPELGAGLRWRRLHLDVTLLQSLPQTVNRGGLGTQLVSSGFRLVASLPAAIGPRTLASIGLGAGVDATHVAPSGTGAAPAFWATDPLLLAVVEIERAWGHELVSLRAGVDWDLLDTRYLVIRQNGASPLWSPWHWRPFVALHLGHQF